MPISRDKSRGTFVFEFDRIVNGVRVRARKRLPKAWSQAQADEYDRKESAHLYAAANDVGVADRLIDDAVAVYLLERVPQLKQGANVARELGLIAWAYMGKRLSKLHEVCRTISTGSGPSKYGKPMAPATIRARIRYLVAACRYAWKHHGMGASDPGARVVSPQVRNARHKYIDRREMLTICLGLKNRGIRRVVRIAFYSGMRLSEILRAEVRGDCWLLEDTKNGMPRVVPIPAKVRAAAHCELPKPAKITVQTYFRKAAQAAGHDDLHFHDLRHSCASEMINAKVDLYTVGAVLGHKDSRSTARYSHLATATLADALRTVGKKSPPQAKRKAT